MELRGYRRAMAECRNGTLLRIIHVLCREPEILCREQEEEKIRKKLPEFCPNFPKICPICARILSFQIYFRGIVPHLPPMLYALV